MKNSQYESLSDFLPVWTPTGRSSTAPGGTGAGEVLGMVRKITSGRVSSSAVEPQGLRDKNMSVARVPWGARERRSPAGADSP